MTRPHPALVDLAAGRSLSRVDDWEQLVDSASEHRMAGLLWSQDRLDQLAVPEGLIQKMSFGELHSRSLQAQHWAGLEDALRRLDEIGVAALTFKGVTAEARWYDRVGERPTTDVDLLVAPGSDVRVGDIAQALDPEYLSDPGLVAAITSGAMQTVTVAMDSGVMVDVHFDLPALGVPILSRYEIWERSRTLDVETDHEIRVLDPETALIQLLLHLNKDCFARLMWYVDVVHLIDREPELDWGYIEDFARTEGIEAPIFLSLDAVYEDLGLQAPPHPTPTGWKAWMWRRLWPAKIRLQGLEGYFRRRHRRLVLAFLFKGRKWRATHWWFRQLFPVDAVLKTMFPDATGPYAWRLIATRLGRGWENYQQLRRARDAK